ncbi:response regulator transcription factor [Roseomonas sp. NAR14]|uniref:Response regulator transcription factor n=1 Tax=Roseomonas acroporae TaxID=2937791 RepID=A0A9X2BXW2_9PROT|nr:response regulator transcription factor [Roseomonas acroporae]MCK8787706.1 response regulator transcription factor [Roseomonas acroporae]
MRVLLVEDDPVVARGTTVLLRSNTMAVDVAATGEEALEVAALYDYDVILVDLGLPDIEGYEVIRQLRAHGSTTPVLILSGLARPQAKVRGLGLGADDFVTKPFDRAELLARIQAVVRRNCGFSHPTLEAGPLSLTLGSRELLVGGVPVRLTGREYAIMELLLLRRGAVLTKEAIMSHLYGGLDEPEGKIIDVFICKLRKKLARFGAGEMIGTVWGRGYVLREHPLPAAPALHDPAGSPVHVA